MNPAIEELMQAAEPFAQAADKFLPSEPANTVLFYSDNDGMTGEDRKLRLADFRRIKAALARVMSEHK